MQAETGHVKPLSAERLITLRYWTPKLASFTTTRPRALNYRSGQYARIALPVDDRLIWRAFSFVSAPHEKFLEFIAVLVPDGLFTKRLGKALPSDSIWIEHESYGFLTADRFVDGEHLWMLATGTGIGSFISILRSPDVWRRFRRIFLVHGVRHPDELTYRDELRQLVEKDAGNGIATLSVLDCISGSDSTAGSLNRIAGRITAAWDHGLLETKTECPITALTSCVMLCGNPQMIEDMRARLHVRGMSPCRRAAAGQFVTENYW